MLAVGIELSLKLGHETEVVTQRFTGLDFGIMLTMETRVYGSKVYSRTWVYPEVPRKIPTLASQCTNHEVLLRDTPQIPAVADLSTSAG